MKKYLFIIMLLFSSTTRAGLNYPKIGQELNYIHVLFEWDQEPNAISYNLQVSNSELFNNVILDINEETTLYIEKDTLSWENTYFWRVRPKYSANSYGEWSHISYFTTLNPIIVEPEVNIFNDELIQDGLIIYGQLYPEVHSAVIDKFGNEIWNSNDIIMNHISSYGQLYGMFGVSRGAQDDYLSDNEYLWASPYETTIDMHEIKQIPNGNYMAFVPTYQLGPIPLGEWTQNFQNLGYAADGETNEFQWMGQRIVEFDKATSNEVWSWNPFEHFTMDDYDIHGGLWWHAYQFLRFDWMHSNAFHFDEEENVIYVSHRNLSRISKISYPSGEVIWNMGLPAGYNTGDENICTDLLFSWQHNIQMLENGDLLFFDNGNLGQILFGDQNPTSRIRRIRVIDDSYCETIWQYNFPHNLYTDEMGSVQLLENGNYFINAVGSCYNEDYECSLFEVTPDGEIIWKTIADNPVAWYRAYKIPSIHPSAFSVLLDNYGTVNIDKNSLTGIILDDETSSLSFSIYNQSGYTQSYTYTLTDNNGWFNSSSDIITINANEYFKINLELIAPFDLVNSVNIDIWPIYHEYAVKSMNYDVYHVGNLLSDIEPNIPMDYILFHNYPNPFNPMTSIHYGLPKDALVNITIYDMMGRVVKTIINNQQTAGYKSIQWDATNNQGEPVSAGVYPYSIQADDFIDTKKMLLLK
ncbi:MAG: aryl-sulfate sulfotransferase [Candidatus Neomarinimicrobiota bacterium]